MAPNYAAQTAELTTKEGATEWVEARAAEARAIGCTWFRLSVPHENSKVVLFEGWRVRPYFPPEPEYFLTESHP